MATPTYKGAAQPAASSGFLSGLGSWFGGAAPAYAGAGQPTAGSSGYATAATAPASSSADDDAAPCSPRDQITIVIPRELIEPQET